MGTFRNVLVDNVFNGLEIS